MDALVSSDGFAVVLEPTLSSLSIAVMIVDIKGANNNNARYYCSVRETIPGSGVSGSLDSARLESPTFFLSVLSRVSCDEDDDPVFKASCGSGVLGCLIAQYQSHRLSSQSHPRVGSDGQHGGLHIICAGFVVSALVAGNRIGYCGLHFR